MARPVELLTHLAPEKFGEVVNMAPKKVREELFRRAGVRNRGGAFALRTAQKTEARIRKLYDALQGGTELPDEIAQEVIRNYLYHRRELLADALDFLEVKHDQGLTDVDLDFVAELEADKATALRTRLLERHEAADVELYLGFMKVPGP